jgi:hypothetical protein
VRWRLGAAPRSARRLRRRGLPSSSWTSSRGRLRLGLLGRLLGQQRRHRRIGTRRLRRFLCLRRLRWHRGSRRRWRGVLPEELCDGRVALVFGVLEDGVWPSLSSSSVLDLARSSALTHASCPW